MYIIVLNELKLKGKIIPIDLLMKLVMCFNLFGLCSRSCVRTRRFGRGSVASTTFTAIAI